MKKVLMMAAALLVVLTGCEKPMVEDWEVAGDPDGNVLLTVAASQATRSVPVGEVCTRLNVAVFDSGGTKIKAVGQSSAESGFGSVRLSLPEGNYKLVVVGHNGTGSATITNVEKVTFPNNKVTDTFLYFGTLTVTGETQELAITLTRCVAMLRLILDDSGGDSDIASLKFYYLGGSSTLSPLSGFGCVNSKQTEYRAWNEEGVYELYTVPHTAADVLTRLTITAYDAGDNVVGEWTLTNIPMGMNRVTEYTGDLFNGGGGSGEGTYSSGILVDAEWDGVDSYTF